MKPGSLAFGVALWAGLLGLVQATAVLLFAYATLAGELDAQRRSALRDKMHHAHQLLADDATSEVSGVGPRLAELVSGHPELHLAVAVPAAPEPRFTVGAAAAQSVARLRSDTWATDSFLEWQTARGRRMLSLAGAGRTGGAAPYELVLSIDRDADDTLLQRLLVSAATAAPFALALVGASALAVVRFGLRPLKRLREAAAHVSASTLSGRIETDRLPSELRDLGASFNAMLDRLDDGVGRLAQFSGDLAHEMRTPLATALGRSQVALSQPRSVEQLTDVLERNVEQLRRLSRLVADVLFLAQAEHAPDALKPERVDLAREAANVAEFVGLLAEERNMTLRIEGAAVVRADRGLLRRAITNLLSNAVRYGDAGTAVEVHIDTRDESARLVVINRGEAIAPEHLARLYDRFYRPDRSRASDAGGTGLGLAIVKAIVDLHHGSIEATSGDGTTRFTLGLPASSGERS